MKFINQQFEKPRGVLGRLAGFAMSVKNTKRINWVIEQLNVRSDDKLLEIGFGPGTAIKQIAGKLATGQITGIEHSEVMLSQAIRKNQQMNLSI